MGLIGKSPELRGFFPAPLESLDEATLDMDIFVVIGDAPSPVLYRRSGVPFEADDRTRLLEQGIAYVYIPVAQHAAFNKSLQSRIAGVFEDAELNASSRRSVVRSICSKLMADAMETSNAEAFNSLESVSTTLTRVTAESDDALTALLDMSGHDFGTTTHMMNVGIGCALLAERVGNQQFVERMMFAGFVHDIGKRGIPAEILNKDGRLTDAEFEIIKRHPAAGVAILRKAEGIDPIAIEATRDHHERLDGRGYPRGISGGDISLAARVCAIVDVYDALTAARPYRGPVAWTDAVNIMEEGRGKQFDSKLLDHWFEIVRSAAETNSAELPTATEEDIDQIAISHVESDGGLRRLDTRNTAAVKQKAAMGEDRRVHKRVSCAICAQARFIHTLKSYPVDIMEDFGATIIDLSRGGLRLKAPWPLSIGDVLEVRARLTPDQESTMRLKVIRVRPLCGSSWAAGCQFLQAGSKAA
ncbi:MAG: HD domain-containing phosphohydrolase [Phycisphaerales bacterium]